MNELKKLLQLLDPEDIDIMALTSSKDEKDVIIFMDKENLNLEQVAYCYNRKTKVIDIIDRNDQKIHSMSYSQLKYVIEYLENH